MDDSGIAGRGIIRSAMIYTYYWGFICVGINKATGKQCDAFIGATEYETNVRLGLRDITAPASGIRADCPHCGCRHGYSAHDVVYSLKPNEMVPLDHEQ